MYLADGNRLPCITFSEEHCERLRLTTYCTHHLVGVTWDSLLHRETPHAVRACDIAFISSTS